MLEPVPSVRDHVARSSARVLGSGFSRGLIAGWPVRRNCMPSARSVAMGPDVATLGVVPAVLAGLWLAPRVGVATGVLSGAALASGWLSVSGS